MSLKKMGSGFLAGPLVLEDWGNGHSAGFHWRERERSFTKGKDGGHCPFSWMEADWDISHPLGPQKCQPNMEPWQPLINPAKAEFHPEEVASTAIVYAPSSLI